ncbi:MAG: sulfatase-like hydrolase/transferase [Planctomycetota bacterium]
MARTDRPNILVLMSDEHRADVAGFAGNRVIRTPCLDALSADAAIFEAAYTPSPICVPARQCLAVGQLPTTCGVERYGQDLPPDALTFAKHFQRHGYYTVCCGKLHHDGPDQMQGWQRRIGSNTRRPFGSVDGRHEPAFAGLSPRNDYGVVPKDVWEVRRAGVGRGSATHIPDEIAQLGAVRYIESHFADPYYDRHAAGVPTMLMVSFNRPHYPYLTDERRFTYYLNRVEPYVDQVPPDHPFLASHAVRVGEDVTEREAKRATAAYYGMIEEVDHDFGVVLDALDRVGQDLDDWIVIFTSDHGEMLGQHGVWEKQVFYEGSARVPLMLRWPNGGVRATRHGSCVSLCDLYPTLCDLAGLPQPDPAAMPNGRAMDGRSLARLICNGVDPELEDEAVSQFDGRHLMIRRGSMKYMLLGESDDRGRRERLFDLKSDPDELHDLMDSTAVASQVAALRRRAADLGFVAP